MYQHSYPALYCFNTSMVTVVFLFLACALYMATTSFYTGFFLIHTFSFLIGGMTTLATLLIIFSFTFASWIPSLTSSFAPLTTTPVFPSSTAKSTFTSALTSIPAFLSTNPSLLYWWRAIFLIFRSLSTTAETITT